MCPRSHVWKLLFLAALALNVVLFYRIAYRLETGCVARGNERLAADQHAYDYTRWLGVPVDKTGTAVAEAPFDTSPFRLSPQLMTSSNAEECAREKEGTMDWFLCLSEASVTFHSPHPKPLVLAKDVSRSRYFAQRDLQGWTIAFENIGFSVQEVHQRSVDISEFSVLLCLGIVAQDRLCLKPSTYHLLGQGQRFNQIHGIRESLWRKDGMCLTLREALENYEGPRNFTFPCWVLPMDLAEFRVSYVPLILTLIPP